MRLGRGGPLPLFPSALSLRGDTTELITICYNFIHMEQWERERTKNISCRILEVNIHFYVRWMHLCMHVFFFIIYIFIRINAYTQLQHFFHFFVSKWCIHVIPQSLFNLLLWLDFDHEIHNMNTALSLFFNEVRYVVASKVEAVLSNESSLYIRIISRKMYQSIDWWSFLFIY